MFEHVGIIHLIFNLLFQCTAGFQLEREHGNWQIPLIWLLSGVGGNIFGANFAAPYSRNFAFTIAFVMSNGLICACKHRRARLNLSLAS